VIIGNKLQWGIIRGICTYKLEYGDWEHGPYLLGGKSVDVVFFAVLLGNCAH
jgi:hypothetical protein